VPKPFRGHFGLIQRNAIGSWVRLHPQIQVILFGDEEGTAEVAQELGVCHVPEVARNEYGTPLLNDVFGKAEQLATHDVLCYVNCDILLMNDFMQAVRMVRQHSNRFLMIGECQNLDLTEPLSFDQPDWEERLHRRVKEKGKRRGPGALDYFVFTRGFYGELPPFALGRPFFDNWLVWRGRALKGPVVDATLITTAIHQNHDYSHVTGGQVWAQQGDEANQNLKITGGKRRHYNIFDATHYLTPTGWQRNWGAYFRLKSRWQIGMWKIKKKWWALQDFCWWIIDYTRPFRHRLGLRKPSVKRSKSP
jgi:hypothetical protein